MLALSRPGYVYVMANPSLPGWHKVGHTHRPPHRRAAELSRTAVPTAFDVAFAKFFWDAPAAEHSVHDRLTRVAGRAGRRKEFFNLPLETARSVVVNLVDAGRAGVAVVEEDIQWEDTLEGREELWAWAEEEWKSPDLATSRAGWRGMERLSAGGWAEASWRLSEHLVRADMTLSGGERAAWVLDAAAAQGMNEARHRAAWLRSFASEESFGDWAREVEKLPKFFGEDPSFWPPRVVDTLRLEKTLWVANPQRRLSGAWVDVLPD